MKKAKQIAAITCIVILVLLYILLLVFSICNFPGWEKMFRTCLYATIVVPILTWIYIFLYGKMKSRHTIASMDLMQDPADTSSKKDESDLEQ